MRWTSGERFSLGIDFCEVLYHPNVVVAKDHARNPRGGEFNNRRTAQPTRCRETKLISQRSGVRRN